MSIKNEFESIKKRTEELMIGFRQIVEDLEAQNSKKVDLAFGGPKNARKIYRKIERENPDLLNGLDMDEFLSIKKDDKFEDIKKRLEDKRDGLPVPPRRPVLPVGDV